MAREQTLVYLLGVLVIGDILLDAPGPLQVDLILVERQEEDDQNKDGVNHAEGEDDTVAQLFQTFGYLSLRNSSYLAISLLNLKEQ